ncbi:MAG: YggS family pyridoxal phosphate-dependent enzyme [Phycisphaerae bacterium]
MTSDADRILSNLGEVKDRIAAAATRAGRDPADVRLVAVTKTVSTHAVRTLLGAGQTDIGENRAQQLRDRSRELEGSGVRWHMIGRLQRNKVKYVVPTCTMIHSVDSLRLAEEIDKRAARAETTATCLLEVNVAGEDQKGGVGPEEAPALAARIAALPQVDLAGLMTMAPLVDDAEQTRPVFAHLRELLERINGESDLPRPLADLSMGMTQDYEVAVEEGATIVRVGSALFA